MSGVFQAVSGPSRFFSPSFSYKETTCLSVSQRLFKPGESLTWLRGTRAGVPGVRRVWWCFDGVAPRKRIRQATRPVKLEGTGRGEFWNFPLWFRLVCLSWNCSLSARRERFLRCEIYMCRWIVNDSFTKISAVQFHFVLAILRWITPKILKLYVI